MRFSSTSLSRFGLCIGAMLMLTIYASAATSFNLKYYLPIGLLLMSVYTWLIIKIKSVYPISSTAIGQLCLSFLFLGMSCTMQLNNLKKSIEVGKEEIESNLHSLAFYQAQVSISSLMFFGLLILYAASKAKNRSKNTASNQSDRFDTLR